MQINTKYLTAGVTIAAAAVTAHLMQSGDKAELRSANVAPIVTPLPAEIITEAGAAIPLVDPVLDNSEVVEEMQAELAIPEVAEPEVVEEVLVASTEMPIPPVDTAMPEPLPSVGGELQTRMAPTSDVTEAAATSIEETPRNQFGLACGPILSAHPGNDAMVMLTLTAPCRSEQRLSVEHGDLTFSDQTDHLGTLVAEVPALSEDAKYTIYFTDGEEVSAEVEVPQADAVDRVALLYSGKSGLEIHALEFGADYEEDGHVWPGAPRDAAAAAKAGGGFLTILGNEALPEAMMAQIYTFPSNTKNRDGIVRLSVEAEVTASNCEKEIAGHTVERGADGRVNAVSLTLSMPECAAIGEFLVLKNLLQDLKVASN